MTQVFIEVGSNCLWWYLEALEYDNIYEINQQKWYQNYTTLHMRLFNHHTQRL